MIIYNYNGITKEYIGESEAPINPVATKREGHEVYMLPSNATELKPPKTKKNEVAIFNDGWQIVPDYRGLYMVNEDMQPQEIMNIGPLPEGYICITVAQAQKIFEDDLYYVIDDGKLIKNPNYDEEKQAREDEEFNAQFFITSLGYVRRQVSMKDGSKKDFLTDILPMLVVGIPILTYTRDLEQSKVAVTEQFINECKQQLFIDFYGVE